MFLATLADLKSLDLVMDCIIVRIVVARSGNQSFLALAESLLDCELGAF